MESNCKNGSAKVKSEVDRVKNQAEDDLCEHERQSKKNQNKVEGELSDVKSKLNDMNKIVADLKEITVMMEEERAVKPLQADPNEFEVMEVQAQNPYKRDNYQEFEAEGEIVAGYDEPEHQLRSQPPPLNDSQEWQDDE